MKTAKHKIPTLMNYQGRGNPRFHKGPWSKGPKFHTTKPTWKILEPAETWLTDSENRKSSQLYFCAQLRIIATLNEDQSTLITATALKERCPEFSLWHVDAAKDVTFVIDYPVNMPFLVNVRPSLGNDGELRERALGYYVWQMARTYAMIYEKHYKKVGVWGHGFDDLHLECLSHIQDNIWYVGLGS